MLKKLIRNIKENMKKGLLDSSKSLLIQWLREKDSNSVVPQDEV